VKNSSKLLLIAALCFSSLFSYGQQNDTIEVYRKENGIISFLRLRISPNRRIQDATNFLKTVLQLKSEDELRLIKESTDDLNIQHRLYQQYYKGIKVENAEYLIHGKNGIIEIMNGGFEDVRISSIIPSVNEEQALKSAIGFVKAKKYKWEDLKM